MRERRKEVGHFELQDYSKNIERDIAIALGKVCYHIHPTIICAIQKANEEFGKKIKDINLKFIEPFLYEKSDCVFPGVRRVINKEKITKWKNNINPNDNLILNDNTFPRHLWAFLSMNKPYNGPLWNKSGLNRFELAHVFGHKTDEISLEKKVFENFYENKRPYALFTSASNVVLIPNGLMKPTDKFESIRLAFYKRHIDLYGENLYYVSGFKEDTVPEWYQDIKWLDPICPTNWEDKINGLLQYRENILLTKYKKNL